MAKRKKPSLGEYEQRLKNIEDAIRSVRENPNTYDNIWRLIWQGHSAFKGGMGLAVNDVERTIMKALDLPPHEETIEDPNS